MGQPFSFPSDVFEFVFPDGPGSGPGTGADLAEEAGGAGLSTPAATGAAPPVIQLWSEGVPPGEDDLPPEPGGGPIGVRPEHGDFSAGRPGADDGTGSTGGGNKPDKSGGDGGGGSSLDVYTSGDPGTPDSEEYNITLAFENDGWTDEIRQALIEAAEYLSTIITGDLSDERIPFLSKTYGKVDDLLVQCQIVNLADPEDPAEGNVLAGAAVSSSRVGSSLPASALLQIDSDDVAWLSDPANADLLYDVMLHELIHAMGFGGKWADMGLVDGDRFTGALATWEYNNGDEFKLVAAEDPLSDTGVLIEQDGGAGTAGGHWDEALYGSELMTGYIDLGAELSLMSIAALEDMGYETIYNESVLLIG